MTGEVLAIIILAVAWLLTLAFWRLDTARWHQRLEAQEERWHAKTEKLMDRLQSQVPAVLDRQDAHEERKAELKQPKETYGEDEEDLEAQLAAVMGPVETAPGEGRAIVRDIAG